MIVDVSYFTCELLIPNLKGIGSVPASNAAHLTRFIERYEKEYLDKVLGETLSDVFQKQLQESVMPQEWEALKNKFTSDKKSPIANYVYYHYSRHERSSSTGLTEVSPVAENATTVINSDKIVRAYNEAIKQAVLIREFVKEHLDIYNPELSEWASLDTINIYGL